MKPGRELDALIAEKVMGWVDFWRGADELREYLMAYPPNEQAAGINGERAPVPPYSTDISAAWQVVQNLRERGWFFDLGDKPSDENDMASPRVWNAFVDRIIYGPNADTPMLAICLAALKAIEELPS